MKITSSKKPKMTDEWVATALRDNEMVVELLLRLKHAGTVKSENPKTNLHSLRWGIYQRRSRPSRLGVNLGVGVGGYMKKEKDLARASPMTPLCWSGGSGSGGGSSSPSAVTGDGFEDTSRQASCSTSTGSGSKAINEINSSCLRRSKKKKVERSLDQKVANVQCERRAKNQSLKRIKLAYSDRLKTDLNPEESRRRSIKKEEKGLFFLPDLNMAAPTDEDETYAAS